MGELVKNLKLTSVFAHSSKATYNYIIYNTRVEFTTKGKEALFLEDDALNFKVTITKINGPKGISVYLEAAQAITINKVLDIAVKKCFSERELKKLKEELVEFKLSPDRLEERVVTVAG